MNNPRPRLDHLVSVVCLTLATTAAVPATPQDPPRVEQRAVDIFSDGTRLSGDVFYPEDSTEDDKLPAILLCHGWGGMKSHLNTTYAPKFAAAGFVVLTFDYRGWGESDGRLVIKGELPTVNESGEATVVVQVIRELVDPFDELEDIQAALDFLEGESRVDRERIGIWGTSLGGGLVIWTAAHDARIKTIVSQVGAMNGSWAAESAGSLEAVHEIEIKRARGELAPVPQGVDIRPGLRGTPFLTKFAKYSPLEHTDRIRVPTLLIDAENEDLFDRTEHSKAVYERIKDRVTSEYHVEPGISHYGVYTQRYRSASDRALAWFKRHLEGTHPR